MPRIALLSPELVNKIAAGEVVERPASVVKELVENALDAGARSVAVEIQDGGLAHLVVTDDGSGMDREDARLAFERHATSKLRTADDLFRIGTLGFRGEAVPAIAAVSRFTLLTGQAGAGVGTRVRVEGGGPLDVEDAPPWVGTRVEVSELFFNVPARRKFLKREQTETQHCEDAVTRVALARPDVAFRLVSNGRVVLASPASPNDPRERVAAALSPDVHPHLLPVDERRLGVRVYGWVANPEFSAPNARGVFTFVNRRYVRDRGLNHAVQRAFGDALPPGRQPVVVLFLEVDPGAVDVNVHPQKLEVRFEDGKGVYDAVLTAVARAVSATASSIAPAQPEAVPGAAYAAAVDRFLARAQEGPVFLPAAEGPPRAAQPVVLGFGQARPGLNEAPPPGFFSALRYLGALGGQFWVCEGAGGTLVVLDAHGARERAALGELWRSTRADRGDRRQEALFSASVELPSSEAKIIAEHLPILRRLSVEVEPFGTHAFVVSRLPAGLERVDVTSLLGELCGVLPDCTTDPVDGLLPALGVLACHAATAVQGAPTADEVGRVLTALERADFALVCQHGTVVVEHTPLLELQARARRPGN